MDEGVTDSSGAICDKYGERDPRVWVVHKKNGGLSNARNMAIGFCKGQFIEFVDSNDYIASDMYEKLLEASIASEANVAMCSRYRFHEDTAHMESLFVLNGPVVMTPPEAVRRFCFGMAATWRPGTSCIEASCSEPCVTLTA